MATRMPASNSAKTAAEANPAASSTAFMSSVHSSELTEVWRDVALNEYGRGSAE
jgi:hypothetical protein